MATDTEPSNFMDADRCFAGGGEMAARMRAFDWSSTPLGRVDSWPQSLKTTVCILLTSRYAMWMAWGPRLIFFCNDAYRPTLGVKDAWALGTPADEVWAEIWPDIGPRIEHVLKAGEATWDKDLRLFLERSGYQEETYHTFSYSPLADDDGVVRGMLCVVTEDTERVLGERRLKSLRDLGAQATQAKTTDEACRIAIATLGENPADIPFALLYMKERDDSTSASLRGTCHLRTGFAASPPTLDCGCDGGAGWPVGEAIRTARPVRVMDARVRFGDLPGGAWRLPPEEAIVLPIRESESRISGAIVLGISPCRAFDEPYRDFFELAVRQISTTIGNARAYEAERGRAEALAELDRAKTLFFSNVSHEFRTPLTLMLGPVEDMLAKPEQEILPDNRDLLRVVHRNALRLQKLVNSLLDFSRIEAGRIQASYEPTELASFTAELASVFRSAVERAGMRLLVDCEPLPEPVYVDRDMWEKIVLNLVSNAFKFTLEGAIEVTLRKADDAVELAVHDTGSGISENDLPHLFERFHRIEGTRARTHEGTGIGLALVLELVKLHGGVVGVSSRYGAGTTFTVRIPLGYAHLPPERIGGQRATTSTALSSVHYVEEALRWIDGGADTHLVEAAVLPDASDAPEASSPAGPGADRPSILVADDNADLREYLARLLSRSYRVKTVADGQRALAAIRDEAPDLLLTDVMMPELDGFELLRELRSSPLTRTIPAIMLSARAGEEARVEGLEAGADDYLIKPFSARELLARVGAALELARVRREAAAALRESEQRFRLLFESMDEGYCVVEVIFDGQGRPVDFRFVDVNPAFERQTRLRDAIGQRMRALAPDHEPYWFEVLGRVVATGRTVQFESDAAVLGGFYDICAFRLGPPELRRVGIVFNDITERKRADAERERLLAAAQAARVDAETANRMKDEFLATVSHELRTPLNAIVGWARILRIGTPDADDVREGIEVIERNSRVQAQLIDDLLDISRIISGKLTLDVQRVNLHDVIEAAITAVTPAADGRGVRIETVLDSLAGPVSGDSTRLQQVVWNLLSNAVKFTPRGGKVQVLLERVNSHVEISIVDTGIGIKPEFLPYVFERFRQADGSTTRRHGGLGLGLAIVKQLAEMHGGSVRAKSPGEGQGATFTVTLPIAIVHAQKNVAPSAPAAAAVTCVDHLLAGVRVLVVDDEADARHLVGRILADCHAEVLVAASADEALNLLAQAEPDVLLSDVGMPEKDGFDLIREVRNRRPAKALPAAALTAFARAEDRRRVLLAGFQTHIAKPVDPDELVAVVAALAGRTGLSER